MSKDEPELIARIVDGDHEPYRTLVDRYKQDIYRHCFFILRDEDDAEDAAKWAGFDRGATYGGITRLANGNTRFWVKAPDCSGEKGRLFYEIKGGTTITPVQITDMVAGTCEYTDPTALFPEIRIGGTRPDNLTYDEALQSTKILPQYYVAQGIIRTVNTQSLSADFLTQDGKQRITLPLDGIPKVFDKSDPIALDALHDGDPVALVLSVQATYAAISRHTGTWQNADHTVMPDSKVYGVIKQHHQIYDLSEQGKSFTPLVPDPRKMQHMNTEDAIKYTQDPGNLHQEFPLP